jgi:hypothetical protein
MEISTQQKGKQAEFFVFGELMRRGFDLYLPVIDTGIDALIRLPDGMCQEIQVKSTQAEDQAGYFNVDDLEPRASLFIVCVDMSDEKQKNMETARSVDPASKRVCHICHGDGTQGFRTIHVASS